MSKIDELIQELCPNGVEYKELGAVEDSGIIKLGRGNVISKTDIVGSPGDFPVYSSSAAGSGEFGRYGKYMFDDERITWSIDGGGRFFYRTAHKYSVTNVSGWLKVIKIDILDIKFLYYVLTDIWKTKAYDYTKKAHPSIIRNEYIIPIPPLPIQQEIVRILDNFTKLEAELEAELEARKKQYDYYRNQLLTTIEKDGKWYMSGNEVGWKTLGEVCVSLRKGTLKRGQLVEDGAYPVINSGREWYGFYESYNNEADALIIAARGEYAGFVSYISTKFWAGGLCYPYRSIKDDVIQTKFIYYYLKNNEQSIMDVLVSRGSIPAINKSDVDRIQIPIPPLSEQERIVSILDRFDALVNDIAIGLPAEIAARRKQYEYYRGKLLSFKNIADRAEA